MILLGIMFHIFTKTPNKRNNMTSLTRILGGGAACCFVAQALNIHPLTAFVHVCLSNAQAWLIDECFDDIDIFKIMTQQEHVKQWIKKAGIARYVNPNTVQQAALFTQKAIFPISSGVVVGVSITSYFGNPMTMTQGT